MINVQASVCFIWNVSFDILSIFRYVNILLNLGFMTFHIS